MYGPGFDTYDNGIGDSDGSLESVTDDEEITMTEKKLKPRKPKKAAIKKPAKAKKPKKGKATTAAKPKAAKKPNAEKAPVPTKTLSVEVERPVLELVADFAEMRGLGLDAAINKVLNTGIVRLAALAKYASK